ncbi:nitroreductase family protein [Alkanindiges sp. WGS2144]|uniref:nitroreductase family protein n=1 Tax=Alkanindiges sp. WGS2144 TaxID=3366808 RepID=UPI003753CC60
MTNVFLNSISKRRSIYHIGKNVSLSQEQIVDLIHEAVEHSPSSFHSQSSRIVILFGAQSEKFWNIVRETLRKIVPADAFDATDKKISSFAAGAGTVLFYEDQAVIQSLQEQFALYADNFPVWSEHSTGIAQFAVWSTLANENIGASLQHYNPIIDEEVAATFDIPANWKLRAQMPFGSIETPAEKKAHMERSERFKVFK